MKETLLKNDLRAFAGDPRSAVDAALLISRIVRPETDAPWCRAELRRLAELAGPGATATTLVETLRAEGFAGAEHYYEADNSALDHVLRTRRGIPITLAMVVIGVSECLNLPAAGINFPRHFMVSLDGLLVDPFAMMPKDAAECREWLAQNNVSAGDAFKPATPIDVALRMLNNLGVLARAQGDHERTLELTDYQLIFAPDDFSIYVKRAEIWMAQDATALAERELDEAIQRAPNASVKAALEKKLGQIAVDRPTLH